MKYWKGTIVERKPLPDALRAAIDDLGWTVPASGTGFDEGHIRAGIYGLIAGTLLRDKRGRYSVEELEQYVEIKIEEVPAPENSEKSLPEKLGDSNER